MKARDNAAEPDSPALDRPQILALLTLQLVVLAPLCLFVSPFILVIYSIALGLCLKRAPSALASTSLRILLTLLGVAGVLALYGTFNLVETIFGILCVSFILKLLEARNSQDADRIIYLAFFLIAGSLTFSASLFNTLYATLSFIVTLTVWRLVHTPKARKNALTPAFLASLNLLGAALPLTLIALVIFPRIGPLWSLPTPTSHQVGFSDRLDFDDFTALAQSTDTAFRVTFSTSPPHYAKLYWRGAHLEHYDGHAWIASLAVAAKGKITEPNQRSRHQYQILQEPGQTHRGFSLGRAIKLESAQNGLRISDDGLVFSHRPISKRIGYSLTSVAAPTPPANTAALVQLPPQINPRARELAAQWVANATSPQDVIDQALAFYAAHFRYTLAPKPLAHDAIDSFLFDTREGFCGHFAGSLAFLLRAADLPARVVTGYLGGTLAPNGQYYVIQQSDAHAWVEVYFDEQWHSIDPTLSVAPERVQPPSERNTLTNPLQVDNLMNGASWLGRARLRWDAVDFAWQRFVTEGNFLEGFTRLLQHIGLYGVLIGALAALLVLLVKIIKIQRHARTLREQSPHVVARDLWYQLAQQLNKQGYVYSPAITPREHLDAIAKHNPSQSEALIRISHYLEQALFADNAHALPHLTSAIRKLDYRSLNPPASPAP